MEKVGEVCKHICKEWWHRVSCRVQRGHQFVVGLTQTERQPSALTFTPQDNLESPINKPPLYSYRWTVGGSQNARRETIKNTQTSRWWIQTQDPLAVRQQL